MSIPFKQAKWFTAVDGDRGVWVCVWHCMEAPEKGQTAENVANYFASGCEGRQASAHFNIDSDSIVQCVQCKDVAYGAKGMNRHGIHLELAGYASQTKEGWADPYSRSTIQNAARLVRDVIAPKYGIPPRWLTDDEIRRIAKGEKIMGHCTHADVTRAMKVAGGHTDPGENFPRNWVMSLLQAK